MHMTTQQDQVCDLVVTACELIDRGRRTDVDDARLSLDVAMLLAEVHAACESVSDPELADDLACVAADLDRLLVRLDALPPRVTALTG